MKNKIVYIENQSLDPYFNFGLEYYLTTEKVFEDSTVLLFWRTSPTLMVGKYQNTLEEINPEYVAEKGINLVRRMSGGGTIYTDLGGWQYSFITKDEDSRIEFREYIEPVIEALNGLGISAEFNGRNDLVIDHRKFSGTAQYMHNGFTVHHGSLLYSTDLEEMVRSTNVPEHKIISKGIKSVRDRVTNISDHLNETMGIEEFRQIMVNHLLSANGSTYTLTSKDIERVQVLAKEKFDSWDCIYGKNPKCNLIKQGHFEGGSIEFRLDIHKGKITDVGVYGDFFGKLDQSEMEKALVGCPYSRDAIKSTLVSIGVETLLYKISMEEILNTII